MICIDARMAFSSGIGVFLREVTRRLKRFRPVLLVDKLSREWCDGMEQIEFTAPIYSLQEQVQFPLKIPKCDLFWSPHYNIPLLPIRAKKRVATIHDTCHLSLSECFSKLERIYARVVMGQALRLSSKVVSISEFTKREIHRHFPRFKGVVEVVPNGIDLGRFQRVEDPLKRETARRAYGLDRPFILSVGNLKRHKNLALAAQAFLKIDQISGWKFVIAGKKEGLRNQCEIPEDPRIVQIGEVPDADLPVLYSLAEMLVFPSLYEGFGLPPLEAMACGCPTVVSNAASLPEVCGDAAAYVNPFSLKEMAAGMLQVATDRYFRESLIQKGLERVRTFNWDHTADFYEELFE